MYPFAVVYSIRIRMSKYELRVGENTSCAELSVRIARVRTRTCRRAGSVCDGVGRRERRGQSAAACYAQGRPVRAQRNKGVQLWISLLISYVFTYILWFCFRAHAMFNLIYFKQIDCMLYSLYTVLCILYLPRELHVTELHVLRILFVQYYYM